MNVKTTPKEIETLFYFLDTSVLKGELQESKKFLDILRKEYDKNEKNFEVLNDGRFEHLIKLGNIIDNGLVVKSFDFKDIKNDKIEEEDKFTVEKEKTLSRLLCKNQKILKDALKALDSFQIASEKQKVTFGEVDLVAYDEDTAYVIELKKNCIKHDIIGQIEKYMFDFRMKLIYRLWKKVVGVVVGNSYSMFALRELEKSNIICLKYSFHNDLLELRQI